jgi:hypothetical protein
VWVRIAELDWVPGAGALVLDYPAGHGAAWVTPSWAPDGIPGATCPVSYSITASFVYNSLAGTSIPPAKR